MTYVALAVLAVLFWPIQGTTHGWVWTALMLAAIHNDWRRAPPEALQGGHRGHPPRHTTTLGGVRRLASRAPSPGVDARFVRCPVCSTITLATNCAVAESI